MQSDSPSELFPDMPTQPTNITWEDVIARCGEWELFEIEIEPLIEAVAIHLEATLARSREWRI